jgi:hypothetical protein
LEQLLTTAESLEAITDESSFELLSLRCLRELEPDCRSLIHLGVNAQGKTVVGPLDGMGLVSGSEPHTYVMVAVTTTHPKSLKNKWLSLPPQEPLIASRGEKQRKKNKAKSDDSLGDLPKAALAASKVRQHDPTAKFILYLVTNRSLSSDLMLSVFAAGERDALEIRFLEQTRIRDFLDTTPIGQWLRQEHLGVEADQISKPLLKRLSRANYAEYARDVTLFDRQIRIKTHAVKSVTTELADSSVSLHFLVGSSGVGKSTTALSLLQANESKSESGFWIAADVLERSQSLSEAFESTLRALKPSLKAGCGVHAIAFASEQEPLLLIFDDINRTTAPINLLWKIIGWLRPVTDEKRGQAFRSNLRVLCPLWDFYWSTVQYALESSRWLRVTTLRSFQRSESIECLRGALCSTRLKELDEFAAALQDDPILIGLFCNLFGNKQGDVSLATCIDVISNFANGKIEELTATRKESPVPYRLTLAKLARRIVLERILRPRWEDVERWFSGDPNAIRRLDSLAAQSHLARIVIRGGVATFEFRHDRLLEFFVSEAIAQILQTGDNNDRTVALDPYYVPFLGRAISKTDISEMLLDQISTARPSSLIMSLRFLQDASNPRSQMIMDRITKWLRAARPGSAEFTDSFRLLEEVATRFTLNLTNGMEADRVCWEARFRNGDALRGAMLLSRNFFPHAHFTWLESMIADAAARSRSVFVNDIKKMLNLDPPNQALAEGSLILLGYIAERSLIPNAIELWQRVSLQGKQRRDLLLCTLWAVLRSSQDNLEATLGMLLREVLQLDDSTTESHVISERGGVLMEIGQAGHHGYPVQVLEYLVGFARIDEEISLALSILEHVDHPIALRFVVEKLGYADHRAREKGGVNFYSMNWKDRWSGKNERPSLSENSVTAIRELWTDDRNPEWLRSYAFSSWSGFMHDLALLQTIRSQEPFFFTSVFRRVELGDLGATNDFLMILREKPFWIRMISHIWTPSLKPVLEARIKLMEERETDTESDDDYELSGVLRDIPGSDAEDILVRHWPFFRRRSKFVQVALYISSEHSRSMAAEALEHWEGSGDPFEHIDHTFGLFTYGLADRVTIAQLTSLLPYLNKLPPRTLDHLVEFCGRSGLRDFAIKHLLRTVRAILENVPQDGEDDRRMLRHSTVEWFPEEKDHLNALNEAAKDSRWQTHKLERWIEGFTRRGERPPNLTEVLGRWMPDLPSDPQFELAATLVRHWGLRTDLKFLRTLRQVQTERGALTLEDVSYDVMRRSLT